MRMSLNFIICFRAIHAGFRESLIRHEVPVLSDYVQHEVSYGHAKRQQSEVHLLFQRLKRLNINAVLAQTHQSQEINHEHDELKNREAQNLEVFSALQNMFKDLQLE